MIKNNLETPRLLLRTWKVEDAFDLFEYAKSVDVGPNAGWPPHRSIDESKTIVERFMKDNEVWAIEHKEHHKVIGSIGLHKDVKRDGFHCRMLGYVLSSDYWGKGLMSEAVQSILLHGFMTIGLEMISVYHYPFNERSRKVIENNGFQFEGTLRQASIIYDGEVYDDVCYSMTKKEYLHFVDHTKMK